MQSGSNVRDSGRLRESRQEVGRRRFAHRVSRRPGARARHDDFNFHDNRQLSDKAPSTSRRFLCNRPGPDLRITQRRSSASFDRAARCLDELWHKDLRGAASTTTVLALASGVPPSV
eukprot:scaffold99258_cov33-Phaeocystis_antarctica.AAC.1